MKKNIAIIMGGYSSEVDISLNSGAVVYQNLSILLADNSTDNQEYVLQAVKDYIYLYQKPGETFQFSELADYMQTIGARLNNPDPTSDLAIEIEEVLDVGTVTWI